MQSRFAGGRLGWLPAALVWTAGVSATPISGSLTGSFGVTSPGVLVSNNGASSTNGDCIQFCTTSTAAGCTGPLTGAGAFTVSGTGTNSFAVLGSTDYGTVLNTTDNPADAASQGAGWDFQANLLAPATCTMSIPSQECLGPFQLNQNNSNVNVFMSVFGTLINKNDGSKSNLDISFSTTYDNTTIAAVVADAETTTGAFNPSWAATITATAITATNSVPEPSPASPLIAGGCLLALSQIRRKRRTQ